MNDLQKAMAALEKLRTIVQMPPHVKAKADAAQAAFAKATTPREKEVARADLVEVHAELSGFLEVAMAHAAFLKCVNPAAGQSVAKFYGRP